MKKDERLLENDSGFMIDKVRVWFNRNKDCLNLSSIAKRAGISRFVLINLMAGKTELSERKSKELLLWLEDFCNLNKTAEVIEENPNGLIKAYDDEFI